MSHRCLAAVLTVTALVSLAPERAAAQSAPRTSWGDPDLQGVWSYATITPLQRPTEMAGREFLTDEEVAAQNTDAATRASSERRGELTPAADLGLAYNQVWWGPGHIEWSHVADRGSVGRETSAVDLRGPAETSGATGVESGAPI